MSRHVTISLSAQEREHLDNLIRKGNAPARVQTRARILFLSDQSQGQHRTEQQIADALLCSPSTVGNVRRRFAAQGLQAALVEKPRPGQRPKITGDIEAQLTLLACSDAPKGHERWTVRLLANKLVEMGCLDSISHVAVYERLKKTNLNPGR
jgi:transposase